jgi:hypothetical protein
MDWAHWPFRDELMRGMYLRMVDILAWLDKKSREQQLYVGDNKSSTP